MRVYFTASTALNGEFTGIYSEILTILKDNNCTILSGQQIVDKKVLEKEKLLDKTTIFKREKNLIEQADFIVAEVTKPSSGVGGEIVYALMHEKPVLALVQEKSEDAISPMIAGNPSHNFFLHYYRQKQLAYLIEDFISHIDSLSKRKGKFIVIDGADGSGKTIQAQLLITYLKKKNIPASYFDFPQYYASFHGDIVARFLRGEFGNMNEISPYLISLAFALDRASAKKEMDDMLKKGNIIIANRYAGSNMAHQGARIIDDKEREKYLTWVYDLEYKIHKIPKEDCVVYLHVPYTIAQTLSQQKGQRAHLKGKADIAENDIKHQAQSEQMYLSLCRKFKHWIKIDCIDPHTNNIYAPHIIHEKILESLVKQGILA